MCNPYTLISTFGVQSFRECGMWRELEKLCNLPDRYSVVVKVLCTLDEVQNSGKLSLMGMVETEGLLSLRQCSKKTKIFILSFCTKITHKLKAIIK